MFKILKTKAFLLLLLSLFFIQTETQAFHIVGGEMTYRCTGLDNYEVHLFVYRDCHGEGAPFDNPAYLFVFDESGSLYAKVEMPLGEIETVQPPTDICVETLPLVCVEKTEYIANGNLPAENGPYTLVYQRYSRNSTVVNIFAPEQTGSSYTSVIPTTDLAICNSSPVFNNFPPTVICVNSPIFINQSATDIDGDSLVYELCDPLIGGSDACPQPGDSINCSPAFLPANPPPYATVDWRSPYSASNPLGGEPQVTIDLETGLLTGTPTELGQFVVGICVTEYRDGVEINSIRRDFQFNVTDCVSVFAAVQSDEVTANGEFVLDDCSAYEIQFINTSVGAIAYLWDFGDPTVTNDFSNLTDPFYEYPDTGTYVATLIADTGFDNCVDTAKIIVKVYPILNNDFTYEATCSNEPVFFTDVSTTTYGEIDSWFWLFANGDISTEQNPSANLQGNEQDVILTTTTTLGCELTTTHEIVVPPSPYATFSTTLRCPQLPIDFFDETFSYGSEIISWNWNFGNPSLPDNTSTLQNPTHTYGQAGDYTVTLSMETEDNCTSTFTETITIFPNFLADAGQDLEICYGDSIVLSASDEFDWFLYEWSPTENMNDSTSRTPMVSPTETTIYTVTISDPNGCMEIDEMTVLVNPLPAISVPDNQAICLGDTIDLVGVIGNEAVSFEWIGESIIESNEEMILVAPTENTTYTLIATDLKGCINEASVDMEVIFPVSTQTDSDVSICYGDSVQLNASGAVNYRWLPNVNLSDANISNPIAFPTETTSYIVEAYNDCFNDFDTITITVLQLPEVDAGENMTLNVGETAELNGLGTNILEWSPTNGLSDANIANPIASPLESVIYTLYTTDSFGCKNSDTMSIEVTRFFDAILPNAFSPNDDNINDVFSIFAQRGLKELQHFSVYNRWGKPVFETKDFAEGWNGQLKGLDLEVGVYVYHIKATTFLDTEYEKKGNVTLIR
ncbi:MAG: PKD domain-containing protein [Chitinophagales bacterium]